MTETIYTIGHSTHPIDEFLSLLDRHRIITLADVRRHPGSRRHPHFSRDNLQETVPGYRWLGESLGGRRRAVRPEVDNGAWEHPAFRSYADYTTTAEFDAGIRELEALPGPVGVMCSEGLWWRCHRRIVSDVLLVRGWRVVHVMPDGSLTEHALPDFARVDDGRVSYPAPQLSLARDV